MTSEYDFLLEQRALARDWVFLGYQTDVPKLDDWIRTELAGESIFIQRFKSGIRAFKNRCAHRHFPLRNEDSGSGPIICGFHHWRYNEDGIAYGIPHCKDVFGKTPKEIGARLETIEIDTCGDLIFGRLMTEDHDRPNLQVWLGETYNIIKFIGEDTPIARPSIVSEVAANWRLLMHISLDDYHIVAVHPSTFGSKGYLNKEAVRYIRIGNHSAFMPGKTADELQIMSQACADGTFALDGYCIFQFFPNLIMILTESTSVLGHRFHHVLFQHFRPQSIGKTISTTRWKPLTPGAQRGQAPGLFRRVAEPFVSIGVRFGARKIHREDNQICEELQTNIEWKNGPGILSRQEQRIAWFEDTYAAALSRSTN